MRYLGERSGGSAERGGGVHHRATVGGAVTAILAGLLMGVGSLVSQPAAAISFQHPPAQVESTFGIGKVHHLHVVHTGSKTPRSSALSPTTNSMLGLPLPLDVPMPLTGPLSLPAAATVIPGLAETAPSAATAPPELVPGDTGVPPRGRAVAFGCAAALAYLEAYAAPNFILQCPGNAQGHEATTMCVSGLGLCNLGRFIVIAVPCAAAYMNEASNSWVLLGLSHAVIDPYGSCR
jgi:hypothetical protein